MWSHYADSHKGIAIEYKLEEDYLNDNNIYSNALKYKDEELRYDKIEYLIGEGLFTKQTYWKYENEYRIISKDKNLLNAPPIVSITFGYKCSDEDKKTIKDIINQFYKDKNIKFYKMKRDGRKLKIQDDFEVQ